MVAALRKLRQVISRILHVGNAEPNLKWRAGPKAVISFISSTAHILAWLGEQPGFC